MYRPSRKQKDKKIERTENKDDNMVIKTLHCTVRGGSGMAHTLH